MQRENRKWIVLIILMILAGLTSCIEGHAQGPTETVSAMESYVEDVADEFDLSECLLASLIYEESRFEVEENLTQIMSKKWFSEGFDYCESDDITNPYVNIRCCGYYLNKWAKENEGEPALWLMCWNMGEDTAKESYYSGTVSNYAKRILRRAEKWENEGIPY